MYRDPENSLASPKKSRGDACRKLPGIDKIVSLCFNICNILHKSTKIENPALSKHISVLLGAINNPLFNMSLDCIPPLVLNAIDWCRIRDISSMYNKYCIFYKNTASQESVRRSETFKIFRGIRPEPWWMDTLEEAKKWRIHDLTGASLCEKKALDNLGHVLDHWPAKSL